MKQTYADNLRNSHKKYEENKWEERSRKSLHHIVAAVCFRETSESTYQQHGSVILPAIGFYYSMFHIGLAGLFVEYQIDIQKLERIRHSQLKRFISTYLVGKDFVSTDFTDIFNKTRDIRELVNYPFVIDGYDKNPIRLRDQLSSLYQETENPFGDVINFIREVSNATGDQIVWYIRHAIGDTVGDEFYQTYLSVADREKVVKYLVQQNLTT